MYSHSHHPPIPQVLYQDLDGTLTGMDGGGWVTPNSGLHPPEYCTKSVPQLSVNPDFPGTMCTPDVYFLRMAWNVAQPLVRIRTQLDWNGTGMGYLEWNTDCGFLEFCMVAQ